MMTLFYIHSRDGNPTVNFLEDDNVLAFWHWINNGDSFNKAPSPPRAHLSHVLSLDFLFSPNLTSGPIGNKFHE